MRRRMYTRRQWLWIWERLCQGYTYRELGAFLGLNPRSIQRRFVQMGLRPECREELVPLGERRGEFRALEDEECP